MGFAVSRESGERFDFLARADGESYAVELRSQPIFRRKELRGLLADGILRLNRYAVTVGLKPLVAIYFDEKASDDAFEEIGRYLEEFAPGIDWLALDSFGHRLVQLGGERRERAADASRAHGREPKSQRQDPFSPRGQWVLKVALMGGMSEERYWGGAQIGPLSVSALAERSQVAQSYVSSVLGSLQDAGHLTWTARGPVFVGLRRLLDAWASALHFRQDRVVHARVAAPLSETLAFEELDRALEGYGERYQEPTDQVPVIGSFRACTLLGLARSNVSAMRLYVPTINRAMERLALVRCEPKDSQVEVVEPRAADSIFCAAVWVKGLRATDVLQCYLDTRRYAARGLEQSDHIYETVLSPYFRGRGWA